MKRLPIASRYALLVVALLSVSLLASGAIEITLSHRERLAALDAVQRDQARAAAITVARFVEEITRSLEWVSVAPAGASELEPRRLDFIKLLRKEPAISTAALIDAQGREQLRVSRISPDRIGSLIDRSTHPGVLAARGGKPHFGNVSFVADTEPYMTIVAPGTARDGALGMADVNLKFVWNVITGIRVGTSGHAYVVDARGRLVAHPDISRVLRLTDLSELPQVREARAPGAPEVGIAHDPRDADSAAVVSAYAKIPTLNWIVFVETPHADALAPLRQSLLRSAVLFGIALLIAAAVGSAVARRMVAPIGELRRGAQRFGAGDLAHRIEVASGDELQELATQFNAMGAQLGETYESLERRVVERTRELHARNAEISEALEQQIATAEILRAISASPTDAAPVFATIVDNARRLCEANFAAVFLHEDGRLRAAAHTEITPDFAAYLEQGFPVDRSTTAGRAALEGVPVQIPDIFADPAFGVTAAHRSEGVRTVLAVPMLREDALVGVITTWRREVRPFTDKQIQLLQIFASQALIALDNVRLFRELETRNREIGEALEQQTATAEILRVISSSPTDAGPVFETIVRSAARLCNASFAFVMLEDNGWLSLAARTECTPEFAGFLARGFPADRHTTSGRAAFERRSVQILDFMDDPEIRVTPAHHVEGLRTVLAAPMLRDGKVLGVIAIWRHEVRAFSEQQIRLLEIFADQAVIAIENFRMFRRIQETSRQLDLANQAKSRLLAAASHDLRQPMHALALYVDQLRGRMSVAERNTLTRRIEEAVGNLSELLDQLLDLSKLEAGAVQVAVQDFAARDLCAAVATQFAPLARSSGLELRVRAGEVWLHSDPVLVQRIVLNLVANALRYTERGGVLLACRRHGMRVRIEVHDTGCGIPDDRREDVFREFVRLDQGAHRRASGLGLGLAIVARLAELLGTRIELRSRVGRGSVFAFELPRAAVGAAAAPRVVLPPAAQLGGVLALVIDDDDEARAAMCGLLARWGCATLAADGSAAALATLGLATPGLIISDYRLGVGDDGLQAIAQLRARLAQPVPAVLVTADTAAATLRAAQVAGVPVLHKPVSPMKLRALLAQLLGAREAQAAA
jgi:signal transduction histidine kinase/CheY-like chemotaxis protein